MFKKMWLLMPMGLLALALVACGEAEISKVDGNNEEASKEANVEETGEENPDKEQEENQKEEQTLQVGESVDFDGLKITLNEARIEGGGEFDTPENEQFVVVNLTAENTTDEEQAVSSIMNVELKDSDNYSYTTTILTEGIKGQFDGQIVSGGTLRGEIPFDVPVSDGYQLHFSNPFKSGKAIWIIPSSELQ